MRKVTELGTNLMSDNSMILTVKLPTKTYYPPVNGENQMLCSYRWTGWVWGITGWSSRLQENYRSLWRNLWNISQINKGKPKNHTIQPVGLGNTRILTNKVEMREMCLDSVACLYWIPIFEWYVIWCGSKDGYQKLMCLRKVRLQYDNHSRFNSQHYWEAYMTI